MTKDEFENQIISTYKKYNSARAAAKVLGMSYSAVRKILSMIIVKVAPHITNDSEVAPHTELPLRKTVPNNISFFQSVINEHEAKAPEVKSYRVNESDFTMFAKVIKDKSAQLNAE